MNREKKKIFIVEDDITYAYIIEGRLNEMGFTDISLFHNAYDLFKALHENPYLVLLDHDLNDGRNGIDVLKEIKSLNPSMEVIMFSGQKEMSVAVKSLKFGAHDYIIKNELSFEVLEASIEKLDKINLLIKRRIRSHNIKIAVFTIIISFIVIGSFFF